MQSDHTETCSYLTFIFSVNKSKGVTKLKLVRSKLSLLTRLNTGINLNCSVYQVNQLPNILVFTTLVYRPAALSIPFCQRSAGLSLSTSFGSGPEILYRKNFKMRTYRKGERRRCLSSCNSTTPVFTIES